MSFLLGLVVGFAARHYYPQLRTMYYAYKAKKQ